MTNENDRNKRLQRVYQLIDCLERDGVVLEKEKLSVLLAGHLGLSERKIKEYLRELLGLGRLYESDRTTKIVTVPKHMTIHNKT